MIIDWTGRALFDLRSIFLYIAEHNPVAARSMVNRIRASVKTLENYPRRGRAGRFPGTRELVIARTPYLAVYTVEENAIRVLAVFHGARDPKAFFD